MSSPTRADSDGVTVALSTHMAAFTEKRAREDFDRLQRTARLLLGTPADGDDLVVQTVGRLAGSDTAMAEQALSIAHQLFDRFEHTRDGRLLTVAVLLSRIAVLLGAPAGGDRHEFACVHLGMTLVERFRDTRELALLLEGVAVLRRVFRAATQGSLMWATAGSQLASALQTLADEQGESWTLDHSIALHEDLLRHRPADLDASPFHHNYGEALRTRFAVRRELPDIDQAIDQYRRAVSATPPVDRMAVLRHSSLAHALFNRFAATEALDDLDDAIDQLGDAIDQLGATLGGGGVRTNADPLLVLGSYLLLRYDFGRSSYDLTAAEAAIAMAARGREAPTAMEWALRGMCSLLRWEMTADPAELVQARTDFDHALGGGPLPAAHWAIAAIRLLRRDAATPTEPATALGWLHDAGLDQQPFEDAETMMAIRFFVRHCGDPDEVRARLEGARIGKRQRYPGRSGGASGAVAGAAGAD